MTYGSGAEPDDGYSTPTTHTSAARRRPRLWRRMTVRGRIAFVTVVVLALGLLTAGGLWGYAEYKFHEIHREHVAGLTPISDDNAPYNILLVGDNCRDCLKESTYGTGSEVGGGRSDVTMLLRINPAANTASILSIPRDLWLPIPGTTGQIRVDAALNNGPGELVKTIEDDLDIPINHYIELNFDTFQDVVNAIGGLSMNFPERMYDGYSLLSAPPGCYHLDGFQALQVVRARHLYYEEDGTWDYDGLGDISRIQRDHEFLRVLATAVIAKGLGDLSTDNSLLNAVVKDLTIDDQFSLSSLLSLGLTMSHVSIAKAPQLTIPVDEDNSADGFTFGGTQYGDVVFPTFVREQATIASFMGKSLPTAGKLPVDVENGSGISGQAGQTTQQLTSLGWNATVGTSQTVQSTPSETVVYYGTGHEAQAQTLAAEFDGAVSLAYDPSVAGLGLTLLTGSNLALQAVPPAGGSGSGSGSSGTGSSGSASSGTSSSAPAATVIGGVTQSDPSYPSFDPDACAPGQAAPPMPNLPAPSSSVLPDS